MSQINPRGHQNTGYHVQHYICKLAIDPDLQSRKWNLHLGLLPSKIISGVTPFLYLHMASHCLLERVMFHSPLKGKCFQKVLFSCLPNLVKAAAIRIYSHHNRTGLDCCHFLDVTCIIFLSVFPSAIGFHPISISPVHPSRMCLLQIEF